MMDTPLERVRKGLQAAYEDLEGPRCYWQCSECGARGWREWWEPRGTCDRCFAITAFESDIHSETRHTPTTEEAA